MNLLPPPRRSLAFIIAAILAMPCVRAQDGQAVDVAKMLSQLSQLKEQQATELKTGRSKILQQVNAAVSSNETAVAMWEEAVRAAEFEGVDKESGAFREWRETKGQYFKEKEFKMALHLHFEWLSITLQRSAGTPVKDLLQSIVAYTKEVWAYENASRDWEENMASGKESIVVKGKPAKVEGKLAENMRDVRHAIVNNPLSDSIYLRSLKAGDLANLANWDNVPAHFDGIFDKIVMPECRLQHDPKIADYWDFRLKREAGNAAQSKRTFDVENFNAMTMPSMLFKKAMDQGVVGFKNRAANDMFTLIKKYPAHPEVSGWTKKLEDMLTTALPAPAPVTPTARPLPPAPAPAPLPGSVPPPVR